MAFKYSSTHVINSLDFVKYQVENDKTAKKSLIVNKDFKFFEDYVQEVRKAVPQEASTEAISFTMPDLTAKANCRLYIYVRSVDNADPLMANDWIFKGKPFLIEFKAGEDASSSAENLKKNANKWINFQYGSKVLSVTNDGSTVSIEVANGDTDIRFYKVEVQEFGVSDTLGSSNTFIADGEFTTVAGWCKDSEVNDSYDNAIEVTFDKIGNSGFGTYMYLLKNLRLPTNANMGWLSYNSLAGELPAVGTTYTQYIIKQCTDRPEVQGMSVIGQYNKSVTYHILWVADSLVEDFEAELTQLHAIDETYDPSAEEGETTNP